MTTRMRTLVAGGVGSCLMIAAGLGGDGLALAGQDARVGQVAALSSEGEEPAAKAGLSFETIASIARRWGVAEVVFVNPSIEGERFMLEGGAVGVGPTRGRVVSLDDATLPEGLWIAIDGLSFETNGSVVTPAGLSLVVTGEDLVPAEVVADLNASTISVGCGDGYYACCGKNKHGEWRAKCIPNNQNPPGNTVDYPEDCVSGGPGATACGVPRATVTVTYELAFDDAGTAVLEP